MLFVASVHHIIHIEARGHQYGACATSIAWIPFDADYLALTWQEVEIVVRVLYGQNLLAIRTNQIHTYHQGRNIAHVGNHDIIGIIIGIRQLQIGMLHAPQLTM